MLGRHDRRWFRLVSACALSCAAAFGCGSFGEAIVGSEGAADSGSTNEAGAADAGVVVARDGGGEQGGDGAAPSTCTPPCETFETSDWSRLWQKTGSGALAVTAGASTSGSQALDLAIKEDGETMLSFSAGIAVRRISASVNVLVLERGDGELDLFEIVEGQQETSRGVHLVHQASSGSYVSESSVSSSKEIKPLTENFATYARVSIEVDFKSSRYTLMVGGQERARGDLDPMWKPSALFVAIGAAYTKGVTKPWHVRFDDVSVVTEL